MAAQLLLNKADTVTWRHDSVLVRGLLKQLDPDTKMYCDLDRFRASDNPPATVPINLVSTSARPDVVVQEGSRITLLELTVPHNSAESLRAAHRLKQSKANYCCLLGDLERAVLSLNWLH